MRKPARKVSGEETNNSSQGPRVNRAIKVPEVRVIRDDGEQVGVLKIQEALALAEEEGLDLVELVATSTPPVCKITDFGKYKYQQKRKTQEAKKKQAVIEVKEIQITPSTDKHDVETKQKHIRRWIAEKSRIKCVVVFKGRELSHIDIGRAALDHLVSGVEDVSQMESTPKLEGKRLSVFLIPKVEKKI